MFVLSAGVNAYFLRFLHYRKFAESKKESMNFRLNESQKAFWLLAQCAKALYSLKIVAILLANVRKPLNLHCFESVQNLIPALI